MMSLEQAKNILDTIVRQTRMTREEHSLAGQAIELLYDRAKERAEDKQEKPLTERDALWSVLGMFTSSFDPVPCANPMEGPTVEELRAEVVRVLTNG